MSNAAFITTVVSILALMLAAVLGVTYFMSITLGSRIDYLGRSLGSRIDRVDDRLGHLETVLQGLREDVAP